MKCKDCKKEIVCLVHGTDGLEEYQHDMDKSHYYVCVKCLEESGGVFGSIIHWCNDMFGVFSETGKCIEIDGVTLSTIKEKK